MSWFFDFNFAHHRCWVMRPSNSERTCHSHARTHPFCLCRHSATSGAHEIGARAFLIPFSTPHPPAPQIMVEFRNISSRRLNGLASLKVECIFKCELVGHVRVPSVDSNHVNPSFMESPWVPTMTLRRLCHHLT